MAVVNLECYTIYGVAWSVLVGCETASIGELLESGEISISGRGLPKQFEEEFGHYIGCTYVPATSHGHTALASAFFAASDVSVTWIGSLIFA